jgi:hypothetical protein
MAPFALLESLFKSYFHDNVSSAIDPPLLMNAMPQLAIDLEELSMAEGDNHTLYANMTRNTARPLKVPADMLPSNFHTLYTGKCLRWETIGLVLIMAGLSAQFVSPDDPMFTQGGRNINRDDFVEDMIYASDECISLCQVHGAVNDIMIWLLYHSTLAIGNFYGDNRKYTTT